MAFELPGLEKLPDIKEVAKMLLTPAVNIEAAISSVVQAPAKAAGFEIPEIPLPATLLMTMLEGEKTKTKSVQERVKEVKDKVMGKGKLFRGVL